MSPNFENKINDIHSSEADPSFGLDIEKNEATEKLATDISNIHEKIMNDQDINISDIEELEKSLDNIEIEISGEKFSIKEVGGVENLERNMEIFAEIEAGRFGNTKQLSFLINRAVESLSRHKGYLDLRGLSVISDKSAESLSQHEGGLSLSGLTTLSDQAAESLSKHKGTLYFNGLSTLSDHAAESLSRHKDALYLDGLKTISDHAAESLSKHEGHLGLGGLSVLSDQAAESLSKHEGTLWLDGLKNLSDQAAESLSKHSGALSLPDDIQKQINKFKKK